MHSHTGGGRPRLRRPQPAPAEKEEPLIELTQHEDLTAFAEAHKEGTTVEAAVLSFQNPGGVQGRLLVAVDGDFPKARILHGTPKNQQRQIRAFLTGRANG